LQILVNGEPVATDARNLAELCATLGFTQAKVATAVNGSFVASAKRGLTPLAPQDEVEIVAPRQGG
jgi:sulfur carrier protein